MTDRDAEIVRTLSGSINRLKAWFEEEHALRLQRERDNAELAAKLDRANKEILELKVKCNNLTDAGLLSVTEQQRDESKKRLVQMVREIDKCLSLLK